MRTSLRAQGVSFTYASPSNGPLRVLTDVSLSVSAGELVAVVGPTGCGKTTLLHLLAGLLKPDCGNIVVDRATSAPRGAGCVLLTQEQALFPWKTLIDNVCFGPKAQGLPPAEQRSRGHALLDLVGLGPFAQYYPGQLSGGMKQKAALARALAVRPEVLLMDEPFAALDLESRDQIQDDFLQLWAQVRPTVLLVTHDIEEAVYMADSVLVLSGRPAGISPPLPIGLSRPRRRELKLSYPFLELKRAVWEASRPNPSGLARWSA